MKITLKDIAESTGYSISTISRVLSGSDKISENTKHEILKQAQEMGYHTPRARNNHLSKKLLNIALVATGFHEGEFYPSYFHGLNKAANKNNMRLFLNAILDYRKELPEFLKELVSTYYDGIILFIPELNRDDYEKISSSQPKHFPVISNSLIENPVFPTVTFDSYTGGYLAAKHFHERGYKRTGIIFGPEERSESRFRKNGFVDYINQQPDMELIWSFKGNFMFEAGADAFKDFHQQKEKPRAVFASNDTMANGFLESAKKMDYKIPDDIAIIGYDDLPHNRYTYPTISSIHTDYEALGMATMKAMRERLSDTDLKTNLVSFVPVSVNQRQSS